ncbi:MAG: hypothetical protein JXB32_00265 [Deltaproteobacteria bacterium]|nr:hypothetical protein [Deltaproteobacteria bacterium]
MRRIANRDWTGRLVLTLALTFVLGSSIHTGDHFGPLPPLQTDPDCDPDGGCLACQVLLGGVEQAAPVVLPTPAVQCVSVQVELERSAHAPTLRLAYPRGPPA